jgi:UDP-2,3-diacylglucosamine hydrolase
MAVFFISDLHLCDARPDINRVFFDFLRGPAREAESLYILGDLFEYWAGDDDLGDPFNRSVAAALTEFSRTGIPLKLMHGNRDFLLDGKFATTCGGSLLDDPHTLDLFGTRTVLMHGDTLCTDDVDYQKFRAQVRNPVWQKGFLALPLEARKKPPCASTSIPGSFTAIRTGRHGTCIASTAGTANAGCSPTGTGAGAICAATKTAARPFSCPDRG